MLRTRIATRLALVFSMLLATAPALAAERLLTPVAPRGGPRLAGIARVQALALGRAALADLRGRTSAVVGEFPLGVDRRADLVLKQVDPFGPDARVEEVGPGGRVRALPLPDQRYFGGTVRGEADSRVFLVAARDHVHGFVVSGGQIYPFGPDASGVHHTYALADADPKAYPAPGDFCGNDLHRQEVDQPAAIKGALAAAGLLPPALPPVASVTLLQADVAIETDTEFRAKFSNSTAAMNYLTSLLAAANVIYERDVSVRLHFSYIRLWTSSDPWTSTSTLGALTEVRNYWINPSNDMDSVAGPRDIVHFISGKDVTGGIAYVDTLCDASYGFGVSQVFGSFDLADPNDIWDVVVVTHEIGHNFGSPHTHCYTPPVDMCYSGESGCYSGPTSLPPGGGTIMSYCHLLSGGLSNIDLVFGSVVSTRIGQSVSAATCLSAATTCGDGTIQAGEECDDSNSVGGDGCSAACRFEVCGNGIVDVGETCDDGNTVSGDGCSATCIREPRCGDHFLDPGEDCDDGNLVAGDGCSPSCVREPRCGDGFLDPGEECDDGNTNRDDGCSAGCRIEPCTVMSPLQTIWAHARLKVDRGAAGDKLALMGDFGMPGSAGGMDPSARGMLVLVEGAFGGGVVDVTVPAGAAWKKRKTGWVYNDKRGAAGGVRKIRIVEHHVGSSAEVRVTVSARNGAFPFGPLDLPPVMTLVFGDAADAQVGACGHYVYRGGACTIAHRGARLVCR